MPLYKNLPYQKRSPEELRLKIDHFFLFLAHHKQILLGLLVLLLVSGFGVYLYGVIAESRNEKAWALLSKTASLESAEVIEQYSRTPASLVARLALARKALEEARWDEAAHDYEEILDRSHEPMIRLAAEQNLALALRGKGDLDGALNHLKKVREDPNNKTPDLAKLFEAHLLEEKGQKVESLKIYEGLAQGANPPEVQQQAEAKVKWLTGK